MYLRYVGGATRSSSPSWSISHFLPQLGPTLKKRETFKRCVFSTTQSNFDIELLNFARILIRTLVRSLYSRFYNLK